MKFNDISPSEWRWVALLSGFLVTLTLLPYAWALIASTNSDYQFMGILSNVKDGATYLSKIQQGKDGQWLFELRHTPEPHDPAAFHVFYLLLGHIANVLGLSPVAIFHVARVATSFFMFYALYHLGAAIWQRQRPRRWFFMFSAISSGLGWFGLLFSDTSLAPDLVVPEAFPFYAAYTNPHFPLAIGCMALITAHLLTVFRPGFDEAPAPGNGGILLVALSVVLAIISPPAILVLGAVLAVYTLVRAVKTRAIPFHEARWTAIVALPAFPFAAYYYAVFRFNPTFEKFNEQNITTSPNVVLFLLGFGLLLIVAIPGLIRAWRRFEPDGDQLMLVWIIVNTLAVYMPFFALQRRLFIGLIIPVVYFAVRSLEDYWFDRIPERWRAPALVALIVFILPTHALNIIAPLAFTVVAREAGADASLLLKHDYIEAFDWVEAHSRRDDVLLASPSVSLWIPSRTHLRPVYGHPFETVPVKERLQEVLDFYQGKDCETLLNPHEDFMVGYVLWGEQEDKIKDAQDDDIDEVLSQVNTQADGEEPETEQPPVVLGSDACRQALAERAVEIQQTGAVTIYVLK